MTDPPFTQFDLKDQPPPWTRIVDVSVPGGEHEICQWGYPLWLSAGDVV